VETDFDYVRTTLEELMCLESENDSKENAGESKKPGVEPLVLVPSLSFVGLFFMEDTA